MIKANELRIGNWIYLSSIDKNIKVGYHEIRFAAINPDYDNYHPIPLTPELLGKFGFKQSVNNNSVRNQQDTFHLDPIIIKVHNPKYDYPDQGIKLSVKYHRNLTHIIYLHQLQNLYHALTSNELQLLEAFTIHIKL